MSYPSDFSPSYFPSSQPSLSDFPTDLPVPGSDTDILEAIEETKADRTRELTKQGVVIQHRRLYSPTRAFRSSSIGPETPTKTRALFAPPFSGQEPHLPSSPPQTSPSPSQASFKTPLPKFHEKGKPENLDRAMDNPFSFDDDEEAIAMEDDNNTDTKGDQFSKFDKLDRAFSNPFSFDEDEEEAMREIAADNALNIQRQRSSPGLIGKENVSKTAEVETRNPFILDDDEGNKLDHSFSPLARPTASVVPETHNASVSEELFQNSSQHVPKANPTTRVKVVDSAGKTFHLLRRPPFKINFYRSYDITDDSPTETTNAEGTAKRVFYGIDIHNLANAICQEDELAKIAAEKLSLQPAVPSLALNALTNSTKVDPKSGRTLLWTEKYRAKRFTDLLGDERTHRHVLRWLKGWDPIVFPSTAKKLAKTSDFEESASKKILLLSGPPGLGKTTMAHVLARQAGYEPLEINASDDRTGNVVRNRIKDIVGMETVRMGDSKHGRPVCLIVDEVDGVTGEGGGGEGGFIKALIDLIAQDQKNSDSRAMVHTKKRGKKGAEKFRFFRPIIAICNDLYAPSLRTLRPLAEVVYTRKPPLGLVCQRLKHVMEKEGIDGDNDAIRKIVELEGGGGATGPNADHAWGGDVRGIMVAGEWVCSRVRHAACTSAASTLEITKKGHIRLSKKWVEDEYNTGGGLGANDGGGGGRGNGVRSVVEQVFIDHDSNNSSQGPAKSKLNGVKVGLGSGNVKARSNSQLRNMIEATGEWDKIMTDCFASYPTQPFHDDPLLTKPNLAYDWLFLHDSMSSRVFGVNQDYELIPYLSTPILAFHHLFSVPASASLKGRKAFGANKKAAEDEETIASFSGPKAEFDMRESLKANKALLTHLLTVLPQNIIRGFKPVETIAHELAPYLTQIVQPRVNPVVVGGKDGFGMASVRRDVEKILVARAVEVMTDCCVGFEKARVEGDGVGGRGGGWVYRMEPPLETLTVYPTLTLETPPAATRFAVRQVLNQEHQKLILQQRNGSRQARFKAANPDADFSVEREKSLKGPISTSTLLKSTAGTKRDFFGRVVHEKVDIIMAADDGGAKRQKTTVEHKKNEGMVWCSFNEGFSNAVRKPISWDELMGGL